MTQGVDVSEWQGALANTTIDWPTVAQNVQLAVYRVGNGHRYDYDLTHNRDGSRLCQISGSYWFLERPGTNGAGSASQQVQMWIAGAQFQAGELAQADIEGSLNGNDQPFMLDFCNEMADYMGGSNRLLVYSNLTFARSVLTDPEWQKFPLWAAWPNGAPGTIPNPFGNFPTVLMHQYGYADVPGIAGAVDADYSLIPLDQLATQYGYLKESSMAQQVDTLAYITDGSGAVKAIMPDGTARPITGNEFYGARKRTIDDAAVVDAQTYANWPVYVPPATGNIVIPPFPTKINLSGTLS